MTVTATIPRLSLPDPVPGELKKLHEVFDAIFVINLARRPDRWRSCQDIFQRHGAREVRRIEAVDGLTIGGYEGTVLGCVRSHAQVHERALAEGLRKLLVLEDDFVAPPDLNEKLAVLARTEVAWDLLILGRKHGWGSFAYAATPRAQKALLELLRREEAPADVVLLQKAPEHVLTYAWNLFGHADHLGGDIDHVHVPFHREPPLHRETASNSAHGEEGRSRLVSGAGSTEVRTVRRLAVDSPVVPHPRRRI